LFLKIIGRQRVFRCLCYTFPDIYTIEYFQGKINMLPVLLQNNS